MKQLGENINARGSCASLKRRGFIEKVAPTRLVEARHSETTQEYGTYKAPATQSESTTNLQKLNFKVDELQTFGQIPPNTEAMKAATMPPHKLNALTSWKLGPQEHLAALDA